MKRSLLYLLAVFFLPSVLFADGLVRPPRDYAGSLEERSQEAIIVFQDGTEKTSAKQDLILKIRVEGDAANFAWIVPLPNKPTTAKESAKLFEEVFNYVEAKTHRPKSKGTKSADAAFGETQALTDVKVLSREVVGSYDVAVVQEQEPGALNGWLKKEGYQEIEKGERVIEHYRKKNYVFACIKVSDAKLAKEKKTKGLDLHPLRFSFETGGRDGIFFPMKLTGLQTEPFDVNLYVFRRSWINDRINKYGFEHTGFRLKFRDWDSKSCKPNAGKTWSLPRADPYLRATARKVPTLTKFFQKRHPGERFYLTNVVATNLKPADVREWKDDLWLYPYYTDKKFVPYDARVQK